MVNLRSLMALLLLVAATYTARADGLLYSLPKDGSWAVYQLDGQGNDLGPMGLSATMKGTVRIASVGRPTEDKQPCRWVEVKFDCEVTLGNERDKVTNKKMDWWKVLIPEARLAKGQSPLDHVLVAWYRSELSDSSERMKNPADGRTSLPLVLAGPLKDSRRLEPLKVESKLGLLECEGEQGTVSLKGASRLGTSSKWVLENRMHPDSPFGLVSGCWTLDSKPSTLVYRLELIDFGQNAVSEMLETK